MDAATKLCRVNRMIEQAKIYTPYDPQVLGAYVSVVPTVPAACKLVDWATEIGFILTPEEVEELHCTVMYSPKDNPRQDISNPGQIYTARFIGLEWWPGHKGEGVVVARLQSSELGLRKLDWELQGCRSTFEGYIPHVTLKSRINLDPQLTANLRKRLNRSVGETLTFTLETLETLT